MEETEAQRLLRLTKFTFAKTMMSIPHAWSFRGDWKDKKKFRELVTFIRENGVSEEFYGRKYIYYMDKEDGYKYWSMGAPVLDTTIINRAKI